MIDHVSIAVRDLPGCGRFYDASLGALGVSNLGKMGEDGYLYGKEAPEFVVRRPANGDAACMANGGTIGFHADTRAQVRGFHEAGLAAGGKDEGAPGPRSFTPTAYAAYLRDPVGNKICAYCFKDGE